MLQKHREVTVSIVLFFVAISILMFTYDRTEIAPGFELLSKFAFALLVAVVIRVTTVFLYRDRSADFDKFLALGMDLVHDPLTDENLRDRLGNSRDIRVLKTWFPESTEIETGLELAVTKQQARVRLLLCKPKSAILKQRSLGAHEEAWWGSYKVYHAIRKVYKSVKTTQGTDVQIACYDSWPGCPVIWYDREILMGFYFRGKSSPSWPWVSVRTGSKLAKILDDQFNELWQLSNTEHLDTPAKMAKWLKQNKSWRMLEAKPGGDRG